MVTLGATHSWVSRKKKGRGGKVRAWGPGGRTISMKAAFAWPFGFGAKTQEGRREATANPLLFPMSMSKSIQQPAKPHSSSGLGTTGDPTITPYGRTDYCTEYICKVFLGGVFFF